MTTRRKFPPAVYAEILERQDKKCACGCREEIKSNSEINWDHILPLDLDGKDEPENLQALKKGHHQEKTNKEISAGAKTLRIQKQDGLKKKKPSQKDQVMAKAMGLEA